MRALFRWTPAVLLLVVVVGATALAAGDSAPPVLGGEAADATPVRRTDVPILSLRRTLEPLRTAAAEHALVEGLETFLGRQPADTCLHVEFDDLTFEHRTDDPQSPASVQKLLTAVAALSELGPDHRMVTEVLGTAPVDGVVAGDLYLRGGGDPLLATGEYAAREPVQPQTFTDINRLADSVVAAGVRAATGAVVGDENRYDDVRYNPVWPARFLRQGQIGPLSALSVNDGFAYFAEDAPAVFGPAPDPAAYAAEVFARALRARGVLVLGVARSGGAPAELPVLADLESPPMREIVTQMLLGSDNNTAELLLKELGRQQAGAGTFAAGQTAMVAILEEEGFDVSGVAVADGSGLATEDAVTCGFVLEILEHEPTAEIIHDALPVAGRTGTLRRRFTTDDLAGRLRAKTGTLNQVTGLAGFVDTEDGSAPFAMVANADPSGLITPEAIAAQEDLARVLVRHPALPDLDQLRPR